ncbi:MAG: hypothetical protein HUU55_13015 [Myxococcales bacterium]|nr:hypothetical protein [Myxococcales bacterium]
MFAKRLSSQSDVIACSDLAASESGFAKLGGVARRVVAGVATVAVLGLFAATANAQCLTPAGDITGDGDADIVDIQCAIILALYEQAGGTGTYPGCVQVAQNHTDVNCDGPVNVADVLLMVNYAVGASLDTLIDDDGDGCPNSCEIVGQALTIPAYVSGKSSNSMYVLTPLAAGHQAQGSSAGGGLNIQPKVAAPGQ